MLALAFFALAFILSGASMLSGEADMTNTPDFATTLQAEESDTPDSTSIDLTELTTNPQNHDFFTFRPNLEKLILCGEADAEHICILWYTVPDGKVGLHYHAMTESVYTIKGTQKDAKGIYPTGSLYFNPPGSSHEISHSSGFFILAYASPADFGNTGATTSYMPIQINTADPHIEKTYSFVEVQDGVQRYDVPLDAEGGMSALLIKSASLDSYQYVGNYLLVLEGKCNIYGTTYGEKMLVVAKTIEPQSYLVSAVEGYSCLLLGLSLLEG